MNQVALSGGGGALAVNTPNFWEEIANENGPRAIVGDILKFSKGDYTAGQNNKEIKPGTAMVANMDNLLMGWVRWQNQKPTDQIMAQVSNGEKPKKRQELGDRDESQWEIDRATGKPTDPWQNTFYLVLKATDSSGDLYTFATSSTGGRSAILDLCRKFGAGSRMRPDEYPIVQLRVDSYKHDTYGKIYVPELVIVGWSPKSEFDGEIDLNDRNEQEKVDYQATATADIQPASSSGREPRGSGSYAAPAAATKF